MVIGVRNSRISFLRKEKKIEIREESIICVQEDNWRQKKSSAILLKIAPQNAFLETRVCRSM